MDNWFLVSILMSSLEANSIKDANCFVRANAGSRYIIEPFSGCQGQIGSEVNSYGAYGAGNVFPSRCMMQWLLYGIFQYGTTKYIELENGRQVL